MAWCVMGSSGGKEYQTHVVAERRKVCINILYCINTIDIPARSKGNRRVYGGQYNGEISRLLLANISEFAFSSVVHLQPPELEQKRDVAQHGTGHPTKVWGSLPPRSGQDSDRPVLLTWRTEDQHLPAWKPPPQIRERVESRVPCQQRHGGLPRVIFRGSA